MQDLNLNQFMADVHENAVAHGWWREKRSEGTIRALIHSELSEALESYRDGHPLVWHKCPHCGSMCETMHVHEETLPCEACTPAMRKPEGGAVELIDFVIRILDFMGEKGYVFSNIKNTAELLAEWSLGDFEMDDDRYVLSLPFPEFVDTMHTEIAMSFNFQNDEYMISAAGLTIAYVDKLGLDPVALLKEKHEYNKTRPYLHGGKKC